MGDTRAFRQAVIDTATNGPGRSSADARRAAFAADGVPEPARALLARVVADSHAVTDDDVRTAAAALGEDEVFELVACAALGAANRQLAAALAAIVEAEGK